MFQNIVFAYDGSVESRDALAEGIALARHFDARCHLLAVVSLPPSAVLAAGALPLETDEAFFRTILEEGVSRLRQAGVEATGSLRTWEEPAGAIVAFARETGADLVVIGHHRRSAFDRFWHGSVGHSILDQLPCSLFISMHRQGMEKADTNQE
jgi:nucleotide-binding universal stress UspA family protein